MVNNLSLPAVSVKEWALRKHVGLLVVRGSRHQISGWPDEQTLSLFHHGSSGVLSASSFPLISSQSISQSLHFGHPRR